MIDAGLLIRAGVLPTPAKLHAPHLAAAASRWGIDTRERVAGWLGQILIETGHLSTLEESLWYRTPARLMAVWPSRFKTAADAAPFVMQPQALANRVYALRNGNGPESSGDGWRFRGRGALQTTGRANYRMTTQYVRGPHDYEQSPDLLADPHHAAQAAGAYWLATDCNLAADAQDWDAVTRRVNGPAMLHRVERAKASRALLRALVA